MTIPQFQEDSKKRFREKFCHKSSIHSTTSRHKIDMMFESFLLSQQKTLLEVLDYLIEGLYENAIIGDTELQNRGYRLACREIQALLRKEIKK